MKEYCSEVFGIEKNKIIRNIFGISLWDAVTGIMPNIILSDSKKKFLSGDISGSYSRLDDAKIKIIDAANQGLASLVNFTEREYFLPLVPDDAYIVPRRDYFPSIFYTDRFLQMRKYQILGMEEHAECIGNSLNNDLIYDTVSKTEEKISSGRFSNLSETQKGIEDRIYFLAGVAYLLPLAIAGIPGAYMLAAGKKPGACPFQRSRFYSRIIKDSGFDEQFDNSDIIDSSLYERYFLPNMGIDDCTKRELEAYEALRGDEKNIFNLAEKWEPKLAWK